MARRVSHYVVAGAVAVGALGWVAREARSGRQPMVARPIVVDHAYVQFSHALGRRESLSGVLARGGIVSRDYGQLLRATSLPTRRLRPGLVFQFRRLSTDSVADQVTVRVSRERRLRLDRTADGWTERAEMIPWSVSRLRIEGVINTSLYDALDRVVAESLLPSSERRSLAWALADVYDWEVDFTRDVRPGDRFAVLFERLESPEGERRLGQLLAAAVHTGRTPSYAFYFIPDANAPGAYYDDQGRSLKRAFLRAPLQFRRVTSGFGARYHPILHRWRTHEGIDFAAPYGTPVRATADGIVTKVGWDEGYGNLVELRHANGIRTRYGHLSSFVRRISSGTRVEQGETIAYVGSTGLSTGPHLHYEFLVNGHPMNPQRKDVGTGAPVPRALRSAYDSARARLQLDLEQPSAAIPLASHRASTGSAPND